MRKILRNKRGLAMEMAIGTMLIIFAMCTMLLLITEMTTVLNNRTTTTTSTRLTADSIGEEFFRAHRAGTDFYAEFYRGKYRPVLSMVDEDTERMLIYYEGNSTPMLCVEVRGKGADAKVVRWSYNYEPPTE